MIILGITFVVLLAIGLPVAFTVGLSALSFFVTEQVPVQIVVQKMVSSTQSFSLLAVPFFVFFVGMFMEATANVLLLTPIFLPIITSYGFDPVHFGVMYMILITMGGMTPPIGVTMYTTCSILGCPIEVYTKESIPFVASIIVLLILLAAFPQLVLFLPNLVYGAA